MLLHDPPAIKLLVNCGRLIDKNPLSRGAFVGEVDNTVGFLKIVTNFLIALLKKASSGVKINNEERLEL